MGKTVKNLDQFLTYNLGQFLTYKRPNLGPVLTLQHIYIYIYIYAVGFGNGAGFFDSWVR